MQISLNTSSHLVNKVSSLSKYYHDLLALASFYPHHIACGPHLFFVYHSLFLVVFLFHSVHLPFVGFLVILSAQVVVAVVVFAVLVVFMSAVMAVSVLAVELVVVLQAVVG